MFLIDPHLFGAITNPEIIPLPTLKRVSCAIALLAMEDIAALKENQQHPDNPEFDRYKRNKQMAVCYRKYLEFLTGDALSLEDKALDVTTMLIVEFKTMVILLIGSLF